ncbi:MAG: transcription termination/antitermination NusG family protein [Lishizhenia sp.]
MTWHVLITKPKHEKKVSERLLKMGFDVCMPTKIEHKKWSDRIKKVESPLLPSMVLINVTEKERNTVINVPGVVRYLFWLGKPAVVTQEEVDVLNTVSKQNVNIETISPLQEGSEIEITNLGTDSQKGVIKKMSGNTCWITLKNLGYVIRTQL